jgi:hypothetical protein
MPAIKEVQIIPSQWKILYIVISTNGRYKSRGIDPRTTHSELLCSRCPLVYLSYKVEAK